MNYPKSFEPAYNHEFKLLKWKNCDTMICVGYEIHFGNKIQHSTDGKRWRNISDRAIDYDFKRIYTRCNIWEGINDPNDPDKSLHLYEGDILIVEDTNYVFEPFTKIRQFLPYYGRIWWYSYEWTVVMAPNLDYLLNEVRPDCPGKYNENSYITKNPGYSASPSEYLLLKTFFGEGKDAGDCVIARLLGNVDTLPESSITFKKYQPISRDIEKNIECLRNIDKDRVLFGRTLGRYFTKEIFGRTLYYQITTISGWNDKAHITADICKGTFQGEIIREMEQLTIKGDLFTARELVNTRKNPITITDVLPDFYCPKNEE